MKINVTVEEVVEAKFNNSLNLINNSLNMLKLEVEMESKKKYSSFDVYKTISILKKAVEEDLKSLMKSVEIGEVK